MFYGPLLVQTGSGGRWSCNRADTRQRSSRASVEAGHEIAGLSAAADRRKPAGDRNAAKKTGGSFMQGHRLKDGIPKEEEEKPRKQILQQTMVHCNSHF
jgi:hypothetical protein